MKEDLKDFMNDHNTENNSNHSHEVRVTHKTGCLDSIPEASRTTAMAPL